MKKSRVIITKDEKNDLFNFGVRESKFDEGVNEEENVSEGVEILSVVEARGDTSV